MKLAIVTGAVALLGVASAVQAQVTQPAMAAPTSFDRAAYVTCREAHIMPPESRKQLAVFLANHAASYHGVVIPDDDRGAQLAHLVRGGCTLAPDAYLFTVIDRAIIAEIAKLPKRAQ
jgi:hypothetical protein